MKICTQCRESEGNKTGVLSCHSDSFLVRARVSFMVWIQVELGCNTGINLFLGKWPLAGLPLSEHFISPATSNCDN